MANFEKHFWEIFKNIFREIDLFDFTSFLCLDYTNVLFLVMGRSLKNRARALKAYLGPSKKFEPILGWARAFITNFHSMLYSSLMQYVFFKWPQKSMYFEYELELLKTIFIFTPLTDFENVK